VALEQELEDLKELLNEPPGEKWWLGALQDEPLALLDPRAGHHLALDSS
jgi:hypothetical protein